MKALTAYCVSKRKKVPIKRVKQVWKVKSRNHYLYLIEGEAQGCDNSVWRAVGEEDAHKIAKEIGKAIKTKTVKKKSSTKRKTKRSSSAKKGHKTMKRKSTKSTKTTKRTKSRSHSKSKRRR